MTHHPHVHMIVPGGGFSLDGTRWISTTEDFLLPVPVLTAMFRGKMLALLKAAHADGRLQFFGPHVGLADAAAFKAWLEPLYGTHWHVYAKRPFAGPEQVLAYLARYTHRVAISNKRLIKADETSVTFSFKDYRVEGPGRYKAMTVTPAEFMRRFLLHVLPKGFHRIRHYGVLASGQSKAVRLARARELIAANPPALEQRRPEPPVVDAAGRPVEPVTHPCPCCGAAMEIIERFEAGRMPRHRPSPSPTTSLGIDTS
jgi:hypothetical protein